MLATHLLRLLSLLVFVHYIHMAGSPVLIKMDGKKSGKGKGNLILISGGKCGSPTLIKGGGGKKGGGEMILVGGQNGDCDKPKVQVVKQFVPIPYYIPKPIYKYILRHHYVPVRQVVVKPVPVPVPMKSYSGGGYKSGGGSSNGYSGNSYQSSDNYESGYDDNNYSGSNIFGKYAQYDKSSLTSASPSSSPGTDYITGNSYKGPSYFNGNSYLPSGSTASKVTFIASSGKPSGSFSPFASSAAALTGGNLKESPSENYFFQSTPNNNGNNKPLAFNDDYGSRPTGGSSATATDGSGANAGYHIAPVYQGPNGQLYSNGQMLSKDFLNNNSVVQAFPSAIPKTAYSSMNFAGKASSFAGAGPRGMSSASTNMNKDVMKQYSVEIEEAKKMFSGINKREDSVENISSSSSSEEDSSEKKV